MKISFDHQTERIFFGDLECGDIFHDSNNTDIIYIKIPIIADEYNCVRLDNGEPDFCYYDEEVIPVEYEFRVLN